MSWSLKFDAIFVPVKGFGCSSLIADVEVD